MSPAGTRSIGEPGSLGALDPLKLIDLFCQRIVHTLRTPIGVPLGAVTDLLAGHTLEPSELDDARRSLDAVTRHLQTIAEFGRPESADREAGGPSSERIVLAALVCEHAPEIAFARTAGSDEEAGRREETPPIAIIGEKSLVIRAVRSLARYVLELHRRAERSAAKLSTESERHEERVPDPSISIRHEVGSAIVQFSVAAPRGFTPNPGGCEDGILSLVARDHSLDVLGALVAGAAALRLGGTMRLRGGTMEGKSGQSGETVRTVLLELVFPLAGESVTTPG